MVSVVAPGTFAVNGGVRVRVYYDSTEFNNLPRRSRQWFKHPGHTKADVLADLRIHGLQNAVITPVTYGTENGLSYVEFRNITSFSTFGLVASNISSPLPVGLLYFTAKRVDNQRKV